MGWGLGPGSREGAQPHEGRSGGVRAGKGDRCRARRHAWVGVAVAVLCRVANHQGHWPAGCGSNAKARVGRCYDNNP